MQIFLFGVPNTLHLISYASTAAVVALLSLKSIQAKADSKVDFCRQLLRLVKTTAVFQIVCLPISIAFRVYN